MTAAEQIAASASQGLTRAEIEAGIIRRKMTADEVTAFNAARGIWKLREAKRKAEKHARAKVSNAESNRRWREAKYDVAAKIEDAKAGIDENARRRGLRSLYDFICTYCVGAFCAFKPPKEMKPLIDTMENVANEAGRYMLMMSRGFGKTTFVSALALYEVITGRYSFVEIIGSTDDKAKDIYKTMMCIFDSPAFARDFPSLSVPFKEADGNSIRMARLTCGGEKLKMEQTSDHCILPTVVGEKWSGAKFVIRGITARNLRGLNIKGDRPDLIILDDVQTDSMAKSPEQIEAALKTINQTIRGQFAHHKSGTMLMTATPILVGDLTERIKEDPAWVTKVYPMMLSMPTNHAAWDEYAKAYRNEVYALSQGMKPEVTSTAYYVAHRAELDEGAKPFSPHIFNRDREASAIQHAMNIIYGSADGAAVFAAEYQMQPRRATSVYEISPNVIIGATNGHAVGTVPERCFRVFASVDVMSEAGLRYEIKAFGPENIGAVIGFGRFPHDGKPLFEAKDPREVKEAAVARAVAALLSQFRANRYPHAGGGSSLAISAVGIDAGWQTRTIAAVAATLPQDWVFMMKGVPWTKFAPYTRTGTLSANVISAAEWAYRSRGRWGVDLCFHSDFFAEASQRAWLCPPLMPNSSSVFKADAATLTDFAREMVADRLVSKSKLADGSSETWKWATAGPNHFGDCDKMLTALAYWKRVWRTASQCEAKQEDGPRTLSTARHSRRAAGVRLI